MPVRWEDALRDPDIDPTATDTQVLGQTSRGPLTGDLRLAAKLGPQRHDADLPPEPAYGRWREPGHPRTAKALRGQALGDRRIIGAGSGKLTDACDQPLYPARSAVRCIPG